MSAIAFKAKGQWIMSFDYGSGGNAMEKNRSRAGVVGYKGDDAFEATQRVRLQLDAVASESLSGTVYFEIGDTRWGQDKSGGALGADKVMVEVKRAYLDWIVPNTDLKVRMGLQGVSLPAFATGSSMVFDDDVAGIVLSNKFTDNVSLTAFWIRPYNDNFTQYGNPNTGTYAPANYMDNMDLFGLLLPLSFDGVKVTPWVMVGGVGPNVVNGDMGYGGNSGYGNAWSRAKAGMLPAAWGTPWGGNRLTQYGTAFWAGITGEVTAADPFRLAWDVNYGGVDFGKDALKRGGWFGTLLAEYKLDWGTPGLYAWYSSGDDSDVKNGSERMVVLDANGNNQYSNFAGNGNPYIAREGVLGTSLVGTWGIGARLKDVSFLEGLKHTFRINYFQGTNDPEMAKYITGKKTPWNAAGLTRNATDFNATGDGMYLTSMDSALEFGLTNTYKVYDNLTFMVDAAYIALWLDQSKSVWGGTPAGWYQAGQKAVGNFTATDAWNINVSFVYDF